MKICFRFILPAWRLVQQHPRTQGRTSPQFVPLLTYHTLINDFFFFLLLCEKIFITGRQPALREWMRETFVCGVAPNPATMARDGFSHCAFFSPLFPLHFFPSLTRLKSCPCINHCRCLPLFVRQIICCLSHTHTHTHLCVCQVCATGPARQSCGSHGGNKS